MNQNIKDKLSDLLNNPTIDEQTMLVGLKKILHEEDASAAIIKDSQSLMELVSANLDKIKQGTNQQQSIQTGFEDFDNKFGGFGLGEFIVIGGRPGMGKTQFLVQMALALSKQHAVLYFTYDLSEYHLSNRFMSAVADLPIDHLLFGDLTTAEKELLTQETEKLKAHKIFINDSCHSSIANLRALIEQNIKEHQVEVVMIDYIQMFTAKRSRQTRDLEVAYITRELKSIAKDFNVCIIATSQLSRSVETRGGDKRPSLSDLRESGAIEQDADKVLFIYRPEYYGLMYDENGFSSKGIVEINMAKNRNGRLGEIQLMRKPTLTGFVPFEGQPSVFSFEHDRLDEIEETPF